MKQRCGLVYITRHELRTFKDRECHLNAPSREKIPKYFKYAYNIAMWEDCPNLQQAIESCLSAQDYLNRRLYEVSYDALKEMYVEYGNFLSASEWEDEETCPWKFHKKILREYRNIMRKVLAFMNVYKDEGILVYWH